MKHSLVFFLVESNFKLNLELGLKLIKQIIKKLSKVFSGGIYHKDGKS